MPGWKDRRRDTFTPLLGLIIHAFPLEGQI
jgi:hypothetical protein